MRHAWNSYRTRRFGDRHLVTTDHGSYAILDDSEMSQLRSGKLDHELERKLEEQEILLGPGNIHEAERELREKYGFLSFGTTLHIIVPTLRCNMKCVYCHASSAPAGDPGFDMDREIAEKTVDFILQAPSPGITVEFQGGEPTLNWDIITFIIEDMEKKKGDRKVFFSLVTNMTTMTDERLSYLLDHDVGICTSLDGPKEVHDANRPYSDGSNHETVMSWIVKINQEYKKRGNARTANALVTLTRRGLSHPRAIIDEYVRLGLPSIHLRYLNNLGIAKGSWGKISYSPEEFIAFWEEAADYIEDLRRKGVRIDERMSSLMERKMRVRADPGYMDLRSPCGAAIGQLVYDHDGKIYSCDEGRMIGEDIFFLGNVMTGTYAEVTTSDKACAICSASINDQYICDTCVYKPYCGVCPVLNYAETGNIACNITSGARCRILMAQFDWVVREKFLKEIPKKDDHATADAEKRGQSLPRG